MCSRCDGCNHKNNNKKEIMLIICSFLLFCAGIIFNLSDGAKFTVFFAAYLISGYEILLKAFKNILKGKIFDENFLMCLATIGAFLIKEYPEAIMVMLLYRIGENLQDSAVEKSKKSVTKLADIRPDSANIEKNGKIIKVFPKDVKTGEIIVVQPGEKIPIDGIVIEGSAVADTSALTGESKPEKLSKGDNALSGFINKDGVIKIKTTKEFNESTVSKILELVEHASSKKAKTEKFITKFAKIYTPVVVLGAILIATIPPVFFGQFTLWFERALTFLVISCPCALIISVPLSFFAGIGAASKQGILIKGSTYIEALANAGTFVFDKTGTLTKGTFEVKKAEPFGSTTREELLKLCAEAEKYSNHPIALSIKSKYKKKYRRFRCFKCGRNCRQRN